MVGAHPHAMRKPWVPCSRVTSPRALSATGPRPATTLLATDTDTGGRNLARVLRELARERSGLSRPEGTGRPGMASDSPPPGR
jgi:hypothetical protein